MKTLCMMLLLICLTATGWCANSASNFGGVGIDGAPMADGRIVVRQLVNGGPAHLAGMRVGDVITHIDGHPTAGSDFNAMVATRLRGRAGTPVRIKVIRAGNPRPLNFLLKRRQMVLPRK